MRKLLSLWRSLDRVAGQLAIPATWEREAAEDFQFLRPHLQPTDIVGAGYPCPHRYGDCPRKIVDYGDGEFGAICRDPHQSCNRVSLTAREVLLHELNLPAFLQPILGATFIRCDELKKRGFGTWTLGLSTRRSSMNQPVFLIISHENASFESAVNELLADVAGQFLIMAPTSKFRTVQVEARLQARNIGYVCLEEQICIDDNGDLISIDPLDSADRIPTTPVADRKRVIAEFRVRHQCKVSDIQRAGGVDESDYYKWLNGRIPDHYSTCLDIERVLEFGLRRQ